MSSLIQTLKDLCQLPGISGWEDAVRAYIRRELEPFADEILEDGLGNLLVYKKGHSRPKNKIVLAAHMDEVGIMIREITSAGYLRFEFIGGVDRRVVIGKPVFVGENRIPGVIGMKPVHLTTAKEREKIPSVKDLYIDIGADSREEAESLTFMGDYAVFSSDVMELANGEICVKAIDDRIGCAIMLELAKEKLPIDLWFAFTVQEEIGTRGAYAAAFRLQPDIAVIVEGTTAADSPVSEGAKKVCSPGKGPVIPFMDRRTIYDRGLFEMLRELAVENQIPWQTKTRIAGGTDASVFQRSAAPSRVCGVSAAVRYIHSSGSVANVHDFEQIKQLLELFLQAQEEEEEHV